MPSYNSTISVVNDGDFPAGYGSVINAYYFGGIWKSEKAGRCKALYVDGNGNYFILSFLATSADQTITWTSTAFAGGGGTGDMLKSVYDTGNNGIVDAAESVPYAGVTGKPAAFPTSSANISDATTAGNALLTASNVSVQQAALGLGTAAFLNVPAAGDAAAGQVVKGNDSRLSGGGGGSAVQYITQSLTKAQKYTALKNLDVSYRVVKTPAPPLYTNYTAPTPNGTTIINATSFAIFDAARTNGTVTDIVISAALTNATSVQFTRGVRLWWLNGGSLNFGLDFFLNGANTVLELHGATITLPDRAHGVSPNATAGSGENACIRIDGTAFQNPLIEDFVLSGTSTTVKATGNAILLRNVTGTGQPIIRRGTINYGIDNGIKIEGLFVEVYSKHAGYVNYNKIPIIEDVVINDFHLLSTDTHSGTGVTGRGGADGRGESGIWLGVPGIVRRVTITKTGWMGFNLVSSCNYAIIEDFDIDDVNPDPGLTNALNGGAGIYSEHFSRYITLRRGRIGPPIGSGLTSATYTGFKSEFADNTAYGLLNFVPAVGSPGTTGCVIMEVDFNCTGYGVMCEDPADVEVTRCAFENCARAALYETVSADAVAQGIARLMRWQDRGNDFSRVDLAAGAMYYTNNPRPKPSSAETMTRSLTATLTTMDMVVGAIQFPTYSAFDVNGAAIVGPAGNGFQYASRPLGIAAMQTPVPERGLTGNEGGIKALNPGVARCRVQRHQAVFDFDIAVFNTNLADLMGANGRDLTAAGWTAVNIGRTTVGADPSGYPAPKVDLYTSTGAWSLTFTGITFTVGQTYRLELAMKRYSYDGTTDTITLDALTGANANLYTTTFGVGHAMKAFVAPGTFNPGAQAGAKIRISGTLARLYGIGLFRVVRVT